jgi:hypothetical protein
LFRNLISLYHLRFCIDMAGLGLYLYLGLRFDTWLKKKKIWRRREFDEVRVWDLIFNLRNWKVKSNE